MVVVDVEAPKKYLLQRLFEMFTFELNALKNQIMYEFMSIYKTTLIILGYRSEPYEPSFPHGSRLNIIVDNEHSIFIIHDKDRVRNQTKNLFHLIWLNPAEDA